MTQFNNMRILKYTLVITYINSIIFLAACSPIKPVQLTPTSSIQDWQNESIEAETPVTPQSSQNEDSQNIESTPSLTYTPPPEPTKKTGLELSATPIIEPDDFAEEGEKEESVNLDTPHLGGTEVEIFSLSNSDEIAPEDILQEISFIFGAGGGAGCNGLYNEQPTIPPFIPTEGVLHEEITISSCGWQTNDTVEITITTPDGTIISEEKTSSQSPSSSLLQFQFKTNILTDPSGQYLLTFSGSSGVVHHLINLRAPTGPQIYWNDDNTLYIYNFEPKETVRIFSYSIENNNDGTGNGKLIAWQSYIIDQNGNLVLELNDTPGDWFVAVGDLSGEVGLDHLSSPRAVGRYANSILAANIVPTVTPSWPTSDTGVPACNLSPGDLVTAGENARIWSEPTVVTGTAVQSLNRGHQLAISGTPIWGRIRRDIDASGWWWEVTSQSDNTYGWIWQNRIIECAN